MKEGYRIKESFVSFGLELLFSEFNSKFRRLNIVVKTICSRYVFIYRGIIEIDLTIL